LQQQKPPVLILTLDTMVLDNDEALHSKSGMSAPEPLVRFEGLPGEFSQHDFGQIEVEFVDGSSRRIHGSGHAR
jgi:hypothetical protein